MVTRSHLARAIGLIAITAIALALVTVDTAASPLDAVSSRGRSVSDLFELVLVLSAVVFLALVGVLAYILIRFRSRPDGPPPRAVGHVHGWQLSWLAGLLILFGVLAVFMIRTMRVVNAPAASSAMTVEVIGHQWWWEFRYPDGEVVTANELHLPVDRPVHLEITGADVIHSFGVPEFGWKMDAIPGRTTTMSFQIDQSGVFEGACTEFCGAQHAWMRIRVVAQPGAEFDRWLAEQQEPAVSPDSAITDRGLEVFLKNSCVSCHTVRFADGSETKGGVGPNLTHFGSRETIGAGVLANTPENLADWIHNADSVKPHVLMPAYASMTKEDLDALVAYLEGLD